ELGTETKKQLAVELMGRNSNVILTDTDGHIIDCLRRVDGDMSRARQVLPGLIYRLPPEQEKPEFFSLSAEERLLHADTEKGADQWLLDSFSGLSPLICRELSFRAAGDAGKSLALFTPAELEALLAEFSALEERVRAQDFTPTMLLRDGSPADFSFMPITQYENAVQTVEYADFSTLLEAFYTTRERQEQMRRRSQSLHKSVKSAYERALRKIAARREELRQTENRDEARKFGDLITANLYRLQKGARTAELEDYFDEDCPLIQIALDPLKTPQQNAAAYYRAYNKAKTAQSYLGGLIEKGEKEASYLLSVLDEITRCESERELQEIRRELTETGFLKAQKTDKREKIRETAPLRFLSSAGMEILVGRNNTQNDRLTTQ
ncbi:MAG: NFACT family protein, partial [Bacillota bacterium]